MLVFWEQGYEATSPALRRRATAPFGSQEGLVKRAVEHYIAGGRAASPHPRRGTTSPREAIARLLHGSTTMQPDPALSLIH
ncbi:hypothetical protein ADK38_01705, partial [Streptomyces varsoviensis]